MKLDRFPACRMGLAALGAALCGASALAMDKGAELDAAKAGIAVYPGARADAAAAKMLREGMGLAAAAYRTGDDVAKVSAFYDKQGAGYSRMPGADKEQAGFSAGCKDEYNPYLKKAMKKCAYQLTIQNPWMDMSTGQLVRDTLISIVKP